MNLKLGFLDFNGICPAQFVAMVFFLKQIRMKQLAHEIATKGSFPPLFLAKISQ